MDVRGRSSVSVNCVSLVFFSVILVLLFIFHGIDSNLLVILLQRCHVFSCLRKLSFLHSLSDIPVHKSSLSVHQIELMVQSCPGLSDGGRVAEHADGPVHLGEVTSWDHGWWLVVDAHLETCRTPVDKLNGPPGLDCGNGCVDVLRNHITTV